MTVYIRFVPNPLPNHMARKRKIDDVLLWHTHTHIRIRKTRHRSTYTFPMLFFRHSFCLQHVERILYGYFRVILSPPAVVHGAGVSTERWASQRKCVKYMPNAKYFVNSVAQTYTRVNQNKEKKKILVFFSGRVQYLGCRRRCCWCRAAGCSREVNTQYLAMAFFGWFVRFSYRLTSEHIIYNSFWHLHIPLGSTYIFADWMVFFFFWGAKSCRRKESYYEKLQRKLVISFLVLIFSLF